MAGEPSGKIVSGWSATFHKSNWFSNVGVPMHVLHRRYAILAYQSAELSLERLLGPRTLLWARILELKQPGVDSFVENRLP